MKENAFVQDNLIINEFLYKNKQEVLKKKRKKKKKVNERDIEKLNYSKLYVPSKAKKVSVVGSYVANDDDFRSTHRYARLTYDKQDKLLKTVLHTGKDWDDFYYGASPIIDSSLIIKEIRNKLFQEEDGVYKFVCKYADNFMIHEKFKEALPAIAQYIVVGMLEKFGVKICCDELTEQDISNLSGKNVRRIKEGRGKKATEYLCICGCPSQSIFEALSKYTFKIEDQNLIPTDNGLSFEDCFNNYNVIHTLNGSTYYNGVLLRALQIYQESDAVNQDVVALKIDFERTTYAAIDALSNNFTNSYFLSETVKRKIIKILRFDDEVRYKKLVESNDTSEEAFLASVNEYLSQTISALQIGVSANIISSDGFLLFGEREKGTIDENFIYPGVNGNAEIADKNVAFYKMSTTEDYPDITIDNAFRTDFNGEISREMLAELNIDSLNKHWNCYGISLSGTTASHLQENNENAYIELERRLHFNILFEQQLDIDLYTIRKKQKNATEKYENRRIIGVEYSFFKNVFSLIVQKLSSSIKSILSLKDLITTAMAIIVFFIALDVADQGFSKWISIAFSFLVFLQSIINLSNDFGKQKAWLFSKKQDILIKHIRKDKVLSKALSGKEMHPVVPMLLMCYINSHTKK